MCKISFPQYHHGWLNNFKFHHKIYYVICSMSNNTVKTYFQGHYQLSSGSNDSDGIFLLLSPGLAWDQCCLLILSTPCSFFIDLQVYTRLPYL